MIATRSAMSDAQWAFIFTPPSSTNSTRIGMAAKIELRKSESPTGSSTCLYIPLPPLEGLPVSRVPTTALDYAPARAGLAVRHVLQRHAVPRDGPRGGGAARAAGGRGRVPRGPDLLRADARQHGLCGPRRRARRALPARVRRRRDGGLPLGLVRRLPARARRGARLRADGVPRRRARRRGRRRLLPAPRRLPPDVSLAAAAEGRGPPGAVAARRARAAARGDRAGAGVLWLRRHLRRQERRHVDGDALRQGALRARQPRGGLHLCRQLVPDAHRRRAAARAHRRADGPPRRDPGGAGVSFPVAARRALADSQLRTNLGKATSTIRAKRAGVVAEVEDWEALRAAGAAIKARAMATLPEQLVRLEAAVTAAGGVVHWARDGAEANRIVAGIARDHGAREAIKAKSIATDEIELNEALEAAGVHAIETDLAELIVQLSDDSPSHILVPAIHKNRAEIRALFERTIAEGRELGWEAGAIAEAARLHLRHKFLTVPLAISGANFGIAETGTICVVESEGNGRMCTTLPEVLVTVMGIEKVLPEWSDLEVFLQLLPRSSTGERMNPYTSLWTGVRPAEGGDGPREFHLVLLDNGRTQVLADEVGRQALHCIRCSACLNVCPVYSRTGGHAYESVYPGPIGAILTPQLVGLENAPTLPWASSLCGACYEVCPVRIDIPTILVHLRGRVVREVGAPAPERAAMAAMARVFSSRRAYEAAQRAAKLGRGPLAGAALGPWTRSRELPEVPGQTFRDWWRAERA